MIITGNIKDISSKTVTYGTATIEAGQPASLMFAGGNLTVTPSPPSLALAFSNWNGSKTITFQNVPIPAAGASVDLDANMDGLVVDMKLKG
jgi:hypothetical protein